MFDNIIGITAGVFTAVSLLPQLIKIIREKKAENLSFPFLFILLTGQCLWIWYGILREDPPIILTNVTSGVLNTAVIIMGLKYNVKSA
ncbi:MAG TPA: SemiSWEET family transporter [Ohtaekwangia sp.]